MTTPARVPPKPAPTSRTRTITRLLELHGELVDPVRAGNSHGPGGVPLMPHAASCQIGRSSPPRCTCWRRDVVEVERLLALMRSQAKQQSYGGVSLGTLRWHVVAWYVTPTVVRSWRPKPIVKGRRLKVPTGQDILRDRSGRVVPAELVEHPLRRHPDARRDRAELGVEWMAERWGLGREPMLPVEQEEAA